MRRSNVKKTLMKTVMHFMFLSALFLTFGTSFTSATTPSKDCFQLAKLVLSKSDISSAFKGEQFRFHHTAISTELMRDLPKRPRGVTELRKIIKEEGLFTVIDAKRPLTREAVEIDE